MTTRKATKLSEAPARIYELHVQLEGIEPPIWRRLWVPGTLTFSKLHRVIQTAMGWNNSHLHEFEIAGRSYGVVMEGDTAHGANALLPDKRFKLTQVLSDEVREFRYAYDFGDNWQHTVIVERVLAADEINEWPQCLGGANACPPEDVGGIGGFADFLEAITDYSHDDFVAMRRWWGGPFNASSFDANAVNVALRRLA